MKLTFALLIFSVAFSNFTTYLKERYNLYSEIESYYELTRDKFNFSSPIMCNGGIGGVSEKGIVYFLKDNKLYKMRTNTSFWSNSLCIDGYLITGDTEGNIRIFSTGPFQESWRERVSLYPVRNMVQDKLNKEILYIVSSSGELTKISLRNEGKGIASMSKLNPENTFAHYYVEHKYPFHQCGQKYGAIKLNNKITIIDIEDWKISGEIKVENNDGDIFCRQIKGNSILIANLNREKNLLEKIKATINEDSFTYTRSDEIEFKKGENIISEEFQQCGASGNNLYFLTDRRALKVKFKSNDIYTVSEFRFSLRKGLKNFLGQEKDIAITCCDNGSIYAVTFAYKKLIYFIDKNGGTIEVDTSNTFSSKGLFIDKNTFAIVSDNYNLLVYKIVSQGLSEGDVIK